MIPLLCIGHLVLQSDDKDGGQTDLRGRGKKLKFAWSHLLHIII